MFRFLRPIQTMTFQVMTFALLRLADVGTTLLAVQRLGVGRELNPVQRFVLGFGPGWFVVEQALLVLAIALIARKASLGLWMLANVFSACVVLNNVLGLFLRGDLF